MIHRDGSAVRSRRLLTWTAWVAGLAWVAAAGCKGGAGPAGTEAPSPSAQADVSGGKGSAAARDVSAASGGAEGGSAAAGAVASILESGTQPAVASAPTRFRYATATTADVTDDPELAKAIDSLADVDRGQAVFDQLAPRKEQVLPILRKALWHKTPNVRIHVAKMLALFNDSTDETTDAIVDVMLHDADQDVRAVMARVLVSHKPRRAVPALILAVGTDPFVHVRANAIHALGDIRDPAAAGAVRQALDDRETWVRLRALGAASDLRLKEALPAIRRLTKDSNVEVRKKAQKVLSELGG